MPHALVRTTLSLVLLLCGSRVANAACVISGVKPTVPLPTMELGQTFSFIATTDCATVHFRVPGTTFSKVPKGGPDTGAGMRTYRVVLTESEWNALVDDNDRTFTWTIIGTTTAGLRTRVTTTKVLKADGPVDLSTADAKLVGEAAGDYAGFDVSGAGDVDGDGHDDVLVSALYNDEAGDQAGAAYIVRGPVMGTLDLSLADAKLVGEGASSFAGVAASGAGDVDGDGHDDVLVGANTDSEGGSSAGAAYLVRGPIAGTLDLSLADAKLVGEEDNDNAGYSVSGAGDVNDDGRADVLVDAAFQSAGAPYAGAAYLVLGPVSGTFDLSLADAKLLGEGTRDYVGKVSDAGDVDADGHDDLLVGASQNSDRGRNSGAAYLVLGPVTGTRDLSVADAKLVGEATNDIAGNSISGAGDVDGDGHDDVLVGANRNDEGGTQAGAAYLVRGPVTGTLDLAFADAKLVGENATDGLGISVSGAGDVDGDGHDDLLIGAFMNDGDAGAAYLVLGPVTGNVDMALADTKLAGEEAGDQAGFNVAGSGDVDGDGLDDLLIGAILDDEGGASAGAAYLIYGAGL